MTVCLELADSSAARYLAGMISRIGVSISDVFRRIMPDPFVLAIFLTLFTAILALLIGNFPARPADQSSIVALFDAWRADAGLWAFLTFAMQMCLILITGHAVAMTRPVRAMIDRLAALPQTTAHAAGMIAFFAAATGAVNWGLGLIVGAFLAREVGRSMHQRGIRAHYPLLCAAGFMGLLVWHGGFSGSAPLSMTTRTGAAAVIPQQYLDRIGNQGVPLTDTILSPMNLVITAGLIIGVPLLFFLLAPRRAEFIQTVEDFPDAGAAPAEPDTQPVETVPDRIDTSPIVAWLLALPFLFAFFRYTYVSGGGPDAPTPGGHVLATIIGFKTIGLNEINMFMFAIGLILHGSPRSYMNAAADGARGCAGIIIQFPLYAGIMGMMAASGLIEIIAQWFTAIGNETTVPLLSYVSAGVVNLFVPSGGGQWGIQGPVALETGLAEGVSPGKMIMAVAYGDQLTNMLQPFWALPLLGITGVKARDIVGYTAIIMLAAGAWIALGLLVF